MVVMMTMVGGIMSMTDCGDGDDGNDDDENNNNY